MVLSVSFRRLQRIRHPVETSSDFGAPVILPVQTRLITWYNSDTMPESKAANIPPRDGERRSPVALRDFRPDDFAALAALWSVTGIGNPARGDSLESITRTLERGGRLIVAEQEGSLVGSAWLTDDARRLYVHHMAVEPERQGRGIGARLMEKAVAVAAERGLQMKLEVRRDNLRAVALYRRFGFDLIGEEYEVMIRRSVGATAESSPPAPPKAGHN